MTATPSTDHTDHLVPVNVEARRLPRSIMAIGVLLVVLFATVVMATVVAVTSDTIPDAPGLDDLPVPDGLEVVASMETCTDRACDGLGVVLLGSAEVGPTTQLATAWRAGQWEQLSCVDDGTLCFASADLRLSMTRWTAVDKASTPTLAEAVAALGLDPRRLVYVHYYRCGANHPCE